MEARVTARGHESDLHTRADLWYTGIAIERDSTMQMAQPLFTQDEGSGPQPVTPPPKVGPAAGAPSAHASPSPPNSPKDEPGKTKIRVFEQKLGARHEDQWSRSPNVTGTGAIHVKSFHCKLTGDSLGFLDEQINLWLDAHPQYEVKLVTTSVGEWSGKMKEPNLVVNVWV